MSTPPSAPRAGHPTLDDLYAGWSRSFQLRAIGLVNGLSHRPHITGSTVETIGELTHPKHKANVLLYDQVDADVSTRMASLTETQLFVALCTQRIADEFGIDACVTSCHRSPRQ